MRARRSERSENGSGLPQHPIQVVARRTGLSPDVIRAWERRYGAIAPERSDKNRRLYRDEDVARLRLLKRATSAGRRIGDVARLSPTELVALVVADETEQASTRPARPARRGTPVGLESALEAVKNLDARTLDALLTSAAVSLSVPELVDELLVPLMREVGERWRNGSLRVAHEHMTTAAVRSFLATLNSGASDGGSVLVTTPRGQYHELGALTVAVMVALDGWQVTYLGPNLPAEEIAAAAQQRRARAVLLSIVYPLDDPRLPGELDKLSRMLPADAVVIGGGQGAVAYRAPLEQTGALLVEGLAQLRAKLDGLRSAGRR